MADNCFIALCWFCYTTAWISHKYKYIFSLLNFCPEQVFKIKANYKNLMRMTFNIKSNKLNSFFVGKSLFWLLLYHFLSFLTNIIRRDDFIHLSPSLGLYPGGVALKGHLSRGSLFLSNIYKSLGSALDTQN